VLRSLSPEVENIKILSLVSQQCDNFRHSWTCYFYVRMRLNKCRYVYADSTEGVIACTAFLDGNVSARCNRRHLGRKSLI